VTADGRQIRVLGTQFVVRQEARELAVTLVEGKVVVSPAAATVGKQPAVVPGPSGQGAFTLLPGERLTFVPTAAPKIDRPPLERVTAWERGQVALDNTALADAAAEMNRYSRLRIVIDDPRVAAIHVSGIFQAGDSDNFAQAVAATYRLDVIHHGRRIELRFPPTSRVY